MSWTCLCFGFHLSLCIYKLHSLAWKLLCSTLAFALNTIFHSCWEEAKFDVGMGTIKPSLSAWHREKQSSCHYIITVSNVDAPLFHHTCWHRSERSLPLDLREVKVTSDRPFADVSLLANLSGMRGMVCFTLSHLSPSLSCVKRGIRLALRLLSPGTQGVWGLTGMSLF